MQAQHQRLGPFLEGAAFEGAAHAVDEHHHMVRLARWLRLFPPARGVDAAGVAKASTCALAHGYMIHPPGLGGKEVREPQTV
ncbi:hypothetical protein GCM10011577_11450 [Pseudarthrobacter polychromogenes]|uniref:Uncharacterized protein n=1 Tax=Pseudarthrobacter polychromogenes TaxID=1676 RepID=A0ABQ1XG10_9MICC|nr:hypothetical protein GCM10011577_11450 [Pseudarthrobacter polychromogenes]